LLFLDLLFLANIDGVGVVLGHAVVGEQGIQEGTKYTPLRGSSVKDQSGRCVVAYSYHRGQPVRKSRIQLQRDLVPESFA
jgi:hypothetical protein